MLRLLLLDVPAALRRDYQLFWLATVIFFLSVVLAFILVQFNSQLLYLAYDGQQIADFTRMFDPYWHSLLIEHRSNWSQLVLYIINNNWVAIQLFLFGIVFGVGSLLFLAYTGFSLGLMLGYLSASGVNEVLWSSIMTHSSFESLATIIAAIAGMKWGLSLGLLFDNSRRHVFGLRFAQSLILLLNAMVFVVCAAIIESFWSFGVDTGPQIKYLTGAMSWTVLISFLFFYGRAAGKHENGRL